MLINPCKQEPAMSDFILVSIMIASFVGANLSILI